MKIHNDKFFSYLKELAITYNKLAALLVKKAEAISRDNLMLLDELINEEQVYLLVTRGFDQHLATFRQQTGFAGATLSDIIGELPEDERDRFRDIQAQLNASVGEAKTLNEKCQKLAQVKLYGVKKKMQEMERAGAQPKQPPKQPGTGKLSKSI